MSATQAATIGVNVGFIILSLLATSTRLYRTVTKTASFQIHDVYLLAALICGIAEAVLQCVEIRYGLGLHIDVAKNPLPYHTSVTFTKIYVACFIAYFACNMFVKLSLVAFYRKLSPEKHHSYFFLVLDIAAIAFGVASIVTAGLTCVPLSRMWNPDTPGRCINVEAFFYSNGSFMIFIDIVLYLTPILIVRRVKLSRAKAAAMNLLFALGFVVVIASLMRMFAIHNLFQNPAYSLYYKAILLIWCTVENHLALIIICLPAVKALLVDMAPSLGSTSSVWSKMLKRSTADASDQGTPSGSGSKRSKSPFWTEGPKNRATIMGGQSSVDVPADEIELRKDVFVGFGEHEESLERDSSVT